jgi:hypothetical protein
MLPATFLLQAPLSNEYHGAAPLHQPASAATTLQMSSVAPFKPRLPAAPGAQPKYYSPLTKSMSFAAAGLHAQPSHSGSRVTEAGADTNGRGLNDQVGMPVNMYWQFVTVLWNVVSNDGGHALQVPSSTAVALVVCILFLLLLRHLLR